MLPSTMTGTGAYVRAMIEEFSARREDDIRITVLTNAVLEEWARSLASGPVDVHVVDAYGVRRDERRTRAIGLVRSTLRPRHLARDVPRDLDLLHYPLTIAIPRTRKPTVLSLHDVQHHDLPELFSVAKRSWRRYSYDEPARRATTVMTISHYSKARIVEFLGIEPERIEVIPLGVDTERFGPEQAADDERLLGGIDLPDRFVFYPAGLWPHKNHSRLIKALAALDDRELHLVLTGPTFGRLPALTAEAERAGVADRVRHLGFVDHEQLPALYRRAAGLVFPTLYEGFGVPVVEAMAAGCPVACSSSPPMAEVCGDAALLFDAHDVDAITAAITRLSDDAALRVRLLESGSARARAFDWSHCAAAHVGLYQRTLERAAA
jgi:glycosyltransferase involved in cell wall biosynthesis